MYILLNLGCKMVISSSRVKMGNLLKSAQKLRFAKLSTLIEQIAVQITEFLIEYYIKSFVIEY